MDDPSQVRSRSATRSPSQVRSDGSWHGGHQPSLHTQNQIMSRSLLRLPSPAQSRSKSRSASRSPSPARSAGSWQIAPAEERRSNASRSPSPGQSDRPAHDGLKSMLNSDDRTEEVSQDLRSVASDLACAPTARASNSIVPNDLKPAVPAQSKSIAESRTIRSASPARSDGFGQR